MDWSIDRREKRGFCSKSETEDKNSNLSYRLPFCKEVGYYCYYPTRIRPWVAADALLQHALHVDKTDILKAGGELFFPAGAYFSPK